MCDSVLFIYPLAYVLLLLFSVPGSSFEYCTRRETRYSRYELLWENDAVKKVFLPSVLGVLAAKGDCFLAQDSLECIFVVASFFFSSLSPPAAAHSPHGKKEEEKMEKRHFGEELRNGRVRRIFIYHFKKGFCFGGGTALEFFLKKL